MYKKYIIGSHNGYEEEFWYNEEGALHRSGGLPAVLSASGYEGYYEHGVFKGRRWLQENPVQYLA